MLPSTLVSMVLSRVCSTSSGTKPLLTLCVAVASIIFYGALIDMWGRRNPTIISSAMCSVCLWIVGAYVKIGHPATIIAEGKELSPSTAAGGKAATAMIMIYSVL